MDLVSNHRIRFRGCYCLWLLAAAVSHAQLPETLTLQKAREIALRSHPRIRSAGLLAEAANQTANQARAPYYPTVAGNVTAAAAQNNTTLSAGTLQTSSLYSRVASGVQVGQLVTDFGRTGSLAAAAKLRAAAQGRDAVHVRELVLLEAVVSYYQSLAAEAVLKAAKSAMDNRAVTLRQVRALAQSALKSTVDVSFAEVAFSQAELDMFHAENNVLSARARLAAALGLEAATQFELADEPLPPPLPPKAEDLVAQAFKERPDLATLSLNRDAAQRFAESEKQLSYPSISLLGVAGVLPTRDARLHDTYSAAGVNLSIPVLNGGLFTARRAEAELRARSAGDDVQALKITIARDVRIAWLDAATAFRRLDVTARLVAEVNQALRLAQLRYDNGLGSIVELNQAQFSQTSAQIEAASAKYDYLSRRALLDQTIGLAP